MLDVDTLPMDDAKVYSMIGEGKTAGVFQLESGGMTQFMKELKPSSLEDIIAGISLYRPGPMDQIPRYIRNKNNPLDVKYQHPTLEKILDVTYGCMVYQEQVMQIVRDLAGYSLGRSDLVRRAMSKKKKSVMEEERKNFIFGQKDEAGNMLIKGAIANGMSEKVANQIFDEMMDFASYAFNKSHAAAYAVIGYQTAWIKYYYPVEFMAALLNSFLGSSDKVSQYIHSCNKMGISVLPPDINESNVRFTVVNKKIRFGLAAVKNVGTGAVEHIITERNDSGEFKDFTEFCERISGKDVNKKCIESLIRCGAFDSMGINRATLITSFEKILDGINSVRKTKIEGQISLFDMNGANEQVIDVKAEIKAVNEFSRKELLNMEKEMLGIYISGHPLDEYKDLIDKYVSVFTIELIKQMENDSLENQDGIAINDMSNSRIYDGQNGIVAGVVTSIKTITTKKNKMMAFLTLEDLYGQMELVIFPNVFEKYRSLLVQDNAIAVSGNISIREDEQPKILCNTIVPMKNIKDIVENSLTKPIKTVKVKIDDANNIGLINKTEEIINNFGATESFNNKATMLMYIGNTQKCKYKRYIKPEAKLVEELKKCLGEKKYKNCV